MDDTEKREAIIVDLISLLSPVGVDGVLVTGSLVYGRKYSVTANSDVDLLVVLQPQLIDRVALCGPFGQGIISAEGRRAFGRGEVDCMWDGFAIRMECDPYVAAMTPEEFEAALAQQRQQRAAQGESHFLTQCRSYSRGAAKRASGGGSTFVASHPIRLRRTR